MEVKTDTRQAVDQQASDSDRLMKAIELTANGVSANGSENIFRDLISHLAEALDVDHAYIGVLEPGTSDVMRVIAGYFFRQFTDEFSYTLGGTPCENVMGQQFRYYPENVQELFPDPHLKEIGSQGYAGIPLFDSSGEVLGLMAVAHRQPLCNPALTESLLKVFSVRTAIELERRNAVALSTRKASELQHSENRMRTIVESSIDSIIALDRNSRILEFNPAAEQCFGYRKYSVLGKPVSPLIIPERHRQVFDQGMQEFRDTGSCSFICNRIEMILMRADGSEFPVEMSIDVAPGLEGPILTAYIRDISEAREAENRRRQLETQLQQAQKMEAIGQLTGGIAHDFNNILTAMTGYMTMAGEQVSAGSNPRLARYLERAQRSGQRASDLIRQMLTFSRGQQGEPRPVALATLIQDWSGLLESTLPASVEIKNDLANGVPLTRIDPVQVEQVLMNLCINARDAMRGSGELTVTLRESEHRDVVCASCRQAVNGRHIEMSVSDTGRGIPLDIQQRIFEPFFSTKEVGQGSGMGLSMVHGVVHENGGHLLVKSSPGNGSTISVLLQPLDGEAMPAEDAEDAEDDKLQQTGPLSGRVLLVDDQLAVVEFMQDLLQSWGLSVNAFSGSIEAEREFGGATEQYDLAILDQTMPKMTGLELARKMLRLKPGLPIILYTGYDPQISDAQVRKQGIRALVKKPVDSAGLHALIRDLLTES
jgi:PAS domain S-box-containing protein